MKSKKPSNFSELAKPICMVLCFATILGGTLAGIYVVVQGTTPYYIGDYRFYFTDLAMRGESGETNTINMNAILLDNELNTTYRQFLESTCVHEVCHTLLSKRNVNITKEQNEDVCYAIMYKMRVDECTELLNRTK